MFSYILCAKAKKINNRCPAPSLSNRKQLISWQLRTLSSKQIGYDFQKVWNNCVLGRNRRIVWEKSVSNKELTNAKIQSVKINSTVDDFPPVLVQDL
jgi:hypothetical protein